MVVASERPVIQTALDVEADMVHELQPGQGIFMNKCGEVHTEQVIEAKNMLLVHLSACTSAVDRTRISIMNAKSSAVPWLNLY